MALLDDGSATDRERVPKRPLRILGGLLTSALLFIPDPLHAAIQLIPIVSGLSSPVFLGNAGDGRGRLFIVEQGGVLLKTLARGECIHPFSGRN